MNYINLHIEYLLRHHDCVIVPGIGAFVAISHPASLDKENGIFLPPQRYIVFNSAIHTDDGLLANSYARHKGVSFETAHSLLAKDIEQLSRTLDRTGVSVIGHIGTLHKSEDGRMTFTPGHSVETAMHRLGMYSISCVRHSNMSPVACPVDSEDIVSPTPKTFDDRYYYIPVHKTFARIAASLALVLTVALAYMVQPYSGLYRPVEASVLPVEKVLRFHSRSNRVNDTIPGRTSDSLNPVSGRLDTATLSENVTEEDVSTSAVNTYNLVIGAFATENEAQRYISQVGDTTDNITIHHRGRHFLVVLRSTDDRAELSAFLSNPSVTERFKGAWIWEKKNN